MFSAILSSADGHFNSKMVFSKYPSRPKQALKQIASQIFDMFTAAKHYPRTDTASACFSPFPPQCYIEPGK